MTPILHWTGIFADSSGFARTMCGRRLPRTKDHFSIIGERRPNGWRFCKRCEAIRQRRARRWSH